MPSVPTAPATAKTKDEKKKDAHPRDPAREAIETIVFVVVLVLLLKLFVTEAFVIPTGSMAETLYGYQKLVTCPKCGHEFPVNSHDEVEPNNQTKQLHQLLGYCCPNCRHRGEIKDLNPVPGNRTGDRVLVLKPLYHLAAPQRGDVVVFKFPKEPQQKWSAQNYIKRAMAFGGETIAVHRGELFVTRSLEYPADLRDENGEIIYPRPDDPNDLWKARYMYSSPNYRNPLATNLFESSRIKGFPDDGVGFTIVRSTNDQVLARKRIVWDNDHQPTTGPAALVPARWSPEAKDKWKGDTPQQTKAFAHAAEELDWLRYRHLVWDWVSDPASVTPRPIDNFLGYNNGTSHRDPSGKLAMTDVKGEDKWVGDLIIECEAEIAGGAEVVLELSRGASRFQAKFADGKVTLARTGDRAGEMASRPTKVKAGGKHKLRFANVDARLRVWVDERVIDFGKDGDYSPTEPPQPTAAGHGPDPEGWVKENDIDAPASVGAKGAVTIRSLKLFRDVYYTRWVPYSDHTTAETYYVQPGHYLCLGDNSASSSDSRDWGLVPERLMLGKAVFVFFPWGRLGFIK
ncbi:MAG TPA: S26 family signal peptidase [Gemmataceae bacterium]|nr:S26 family signal peptidase [Gemmataceae bacterium]